MEIIANQLIEIQTIQTPLIRTLRILLNLSGLV